jgi:hypothetical protein
MSLRCMVCARIAGFADRLQFDGMILPLTLKLFDLTLLRLGCVLALPDLDSDFTLHASRYALRSRDSYFYFCTRVCGFLLAL